jgi:hypothetical protein
MSAFVAPSDRRYSKIGDNAVYAPVVCVMTRFGLRRALDLLWTYRDYRRILAEERASGSRGLLKSAFLIEDRRTCCIISIWESYDAIPRFGTDTPSHVGAARRVFGRFRLGPNGGIELWSTKWRLTSVSNNLNWGDFDMRSWLLSSADQPVAHARDRSPFGWS